MLANARLEGVGNPSGELRHPAQPRAMIGTVPPSALQAAPVTYEARSEQRKAITAAISLGLGEPAERPARADRGEHLVARLACARGLLVGEPAVVRASAPVAVGPGVTALQRMPFGA